MAVPRVPWAQAGRLPGCGDLGWGWPGPLLAQCCPHSCAQTHAQLRPPRPEPRFTSPPGAMVSDLPPRRRLGAGPSTPAAGSEQRLPRLPGSATARGGAETVEEGGQRRGRQTAALLPLLLSAPRSAPPGAQSAAAASHAARAGAGCGGGGRRARSLGVIPSTLTRSPPDAATRGQVTKGRVGGYRNLRPFPFSGPSPTPHPHPTHTPHGYSCVLKELPRRNLIVTECVIYS